MGYFLPPKNTFTRAVKTHFKAAHYDQQNFLTQVDLIEMSPIRGGHFIHLPLRTPESGGGRWNGRCAGWGGWLKGHWSVSSLYQPISQLPITRGLCGGDMVCWYTLAALPHSGDAWWRGYWAAMAARDTWIATDIAATLHWLTRVWGDTTPFVLP